MNKDIKILLLGGNGFIGKELSAVLLRKGYKNITTTSREKQIQNNPDIQNISGIDITNPKTLKKVISQANIVINLAGFISFAQRDNKALLTINRDGALNVLHECEKNKQLHRLIHLSSTSAFGAPSFEIDETFRFDWQKHNQLVYSYSKFAANDAIIASSVPTNIIYPCSSLGSGNKNTQSFLKYAKNKKILILPPGTNATMDVRDLVASIIVVLEKAPKKENYISCGESHSFSKLFQHVCKAQQQDTKIIILPKWTQSPLLIVAYLIEFFGSKKIGYEQMYLSFQSLRYLNKKIKKLGYKPEYTLSQTLNDIMSSQ